MGCANSCDCLKQLLLFFWWGEIHHPQAQKPTGNLIAQPFEPLPAFGKKWASCVLAHQVMDVWVLLLLIYMCILICMEPLTSNLCWKMSVCRWRTAPLRVVSSCPQNCCGTSTVPVTFFYNSRAEGFGLPVIEAQACGTPVIVNGATAMAENVLLGKVLLPTARQSPSGGRSDRPGSWTPPDGAAAVEALLEIWRAPPTATERNRVRMALQSFFAPSHVAKQMVQVLQPLIPTRQAAENREPQQAEVLQRNSLSQAFCALEFQEAEQCWAKTKPVGPVGPVRCQDFEESLRSCFARDWDQPTLAPRLEGQGIHRLIPTRFGQMLYNVYDVSVGRTLEICGEWLGGERSIYQQLQLGSAPVTGCWRQMFQVSVSFQVRVIDNLLTMIFHKMVRWSVYTCYKMLNYSKKSKITRNAVILFGRL